MLTKYTNYLSYVFRHKYYVFLACRELGVGLWQSVAHDFSKFFPSELHPYSQYDFGGENTDLVQEAFDIAWNCHSKRNKHHWQYWILFMDSGKILSLPMPEKYVREMLADWYGAGRANGKTWSIPEHVNWWMDLNKENFDKYLHADTKRLISEILGSIQQ